MSRDGYIIYLILGKEGALKFRVSLKQVHEQTGLTHYAVAKRANVAINTVVRYTEKDVIELDRIESSLVRLLDAYGLDWRNPAVVEIVDCDENPEIKSLHRQTVLQPAV